MGKGKRREAAPVAMNEPKPGQHACFALPFKIEVDAAADKEKVEALTKRFGDRILEVLDEEGFEAIDICANGSEAATALEHALVGQLIVAQAQAAQRARNN